MAEWSTKESERTYGIRDWGAGFFHINDNGNVTVCANSKSEDCDKKYNVDLHELTTELMERGIRLPLLIRFPDIVRERVNLLDNCFRKAIQENEYRGDYNGVFPIKVNQHRQLLEHIVEYGSDRNLGLEAGSKPELLVVLALAKKNQSLIICNGFKDEEYIETALLAQKLGKKTIIVIDRYSELPMVLKIAKKLNIKAHIGLRAKLYSQGTGKWIESSGAKSKFGLTPEEMCQAVEQLKIADSLDSLQLVHFHIGSQVKSIQSIKDSLKEGTRYFTEIFNMGANHLIYLDVGGGLGVDYDGTGTSDSSINYSEQEYANDVIYHVGQICDRHKVPHPNIITEAGRSLVAHHSVLIFNVLGKNQVRKNSNSVQLNKSDSPLLHNLDEIYQALNLKNLNESYNDVLELRNDALKLYTLGYLSLNERAKAESLVWANFTKIYDLSKENDDFEEITLKLQSQLSDTYYCNFSIFQSVPDAWAIDQYFPVMPIHRLAEAPSSRAIIADLTCDSDGKMDQFVEDYQATNSLPVHDLESDKDYILGTFLVGAYQESLGDLHNLFGDTDSVDVQLHENGYSVQNVVEGDTVTDVLSYIQYERRELMQNIRNQTEMSISEQKITRDEAKLLLRHYEEGLSGYTYLE